jgi:hypothetical protein
VYSFNERQPPEAIQEDFPSLKRAQIYGAIAFSLDHQAEIDKYLEDTAREFEGRAIPLEQAKPHALGKDPTRQSRGRPRRAAFLSIRFQADNDHLAAGKPRPWPADRVARLGDRRSRRGSGLRVGVPIAAFFAR